MATESPQAGVRVAATLPAHSLRQILLVHLIIFQEALFGCHVFGIRISWLNRTSRPGVPEALFDYDRSEFGRPDTSRLSPGSEYRAVIFKHYCETFCVMMKPFVTRHLCGKEQGPLDKLLGIGHTVTWINFIAKPHFRILTDWAEMHELISHSCLLISDGNDGNYVFDGTADQYGRDWKTHWFMAREELVANFLDPKYSDPRDIWTTDEQGEVAKCERLEGKDCNHGYWAVGYWVVARRRMEQIFQELNWASLRGLSDDDVEERIRSLSMAKFEAVFEEAQLD
ncbi:uncharacterized protein J4E92_005774 [Alternaria infectoria]|uniref:uncharacterized protein n=1 Tax=Alternaria infectoria TaxID=45303 RepID=UPI0022206C9F|nr:uncharacterized protein J4E92_005774 [Alternaria infectoria]KAI4928290.1 hypothetical protein J4E92_005774 [Alternaria infectoria]